MSRIQRFRQHLSAKGIDAYFVGDISNVYYLSGFTGSTAFILITEKESYLISDGRYELQIQEEVSGDFEVHIVSDYAAVFKSLLSPLEKVMVDAGCSLSIYSSLAEMTDAVVDSDNGIAELRITKDAAEIEMIKTAYDIAGTAFTRMLDDIQFGMSEIQWAAHLEYHMKVLGADSTSFDTITASGVRGALPHGLASRKLIDRNEPVIIDYGCKKKYCSDITRVIFSGSDPFVKEIISIVHDALNSAISVIKPGVRCADVDAVARDIITKQGFGEFFNHSLGHGVGIDVHELPRFSIKDDTLLQPGMVITVEPGIYLPERFGIRLEDTVLVTENGCENLSAVLDSHVYAL